jgi:hypothetical protein
LCSEFDAPVRETEDGCVIPVNSVGVQGDSRSYAPVLAIDAPDYDRATALINRLFNINRVIAGVALRAPLASMQVRACSLTDERIALLRRADATVRKLSHESGYDARVWQFPVILIPLGTADAPESVVLRPVDSVDGMTARSVPIDAALLEALPSLGLSSICNVLAAIKTAKYFGYGPDDAVVTVATDGAAMYASERAKALAQYFPQGFDEVAAGEVFGEHILGATTDHVLEPTLTERERIFNLGYFTWVEQQGVSADDFCARKEPSFWTAMREIVPVWDGMIDELNARTGVLDQL